MDKGQIVENKLTGKKGVIINSGWSWQEVRYDDGEVEDTASWQLQEE